MSPGRIPRLLAAARAERRELARLRTQVGAGRAVAQRVRIGLGLDEVPDAVTRLESASRLTTGELAGTQASVEWLDARLRELAAVAERDARRIDALEAELAAVAGERRDLVRAGEIVATSSWVERLPPSDALVSVIVPTHDRPALLREAIASVLRQSHPRFELLVVDDGSGPETAAVLAELDDPRIRWFRRERSGGGGAARNVGLAHARGEYVTYLDDDNLIGALWLRAVVWAFEARPECDVVYGAMVHDQRTAPDGLPDLMQLPWDRQRQLLSNAVDQGMLAHRRGRPDLVYDEHLSEAGDWDFVVRLTADRDPARIPVIAVHYRTRHAGRISDGRDMPSASLLTQQRFARRGPLRVLVLEALGTPGAGSPAATAAALERLGDHVVPVPADGDVHRAIRRERPDVVLLAADAALEARLTAWFTAHVAFAADGRGERPHAGPGPTTSLGRWDGGAPFGVRDGGLPLRTALLRALDLMHAEWLGIPAPDSPPGDVRFPVTATADEPGAATVVRDPTVAVPR